MASSATWSWHLRPHSSGSQYNTVAGTAEIQDGAGGGLKAERGSNRERGEALRARGEGASDREAAGDSAALFPRGTRGDLHGAGGDGLVGGRFKAAGLEKDLAGAGIERTAEGERLDGVDGDVAAIRGDGGGGSDGAACGEIDRHGADGRAQAEVDGEVADGIQRERDARAGGLGDRHGDKNVAAPSGGARGVERHGARGVQRSLDRGLIRHRRRTGRSEHIGIAAAKSPAAGRGARYGDVAGRSEMERGEKERDEENCQGEPRFHGGECEGNAGGVARTESQSTRARER